MSVILMTILFYKALILQGEILMLITLRAYRLWIIALIVLAAR